VRACFLVCLVLLGPIAAQSRPEETPVPASAFEVRGWDIERPDPDYVIDMIHRAHDAGMNTISLSHEVVMNAEEILWDWHRYKHLRRFCDEAHKLDMVVYLWNHQIVNPPADLIVDGPEEGWKFLRFDDPRLREWLYDRYERVVERVPNLDGIILSLTESEFQIHRDSDSPFWGLKKTGVISESPPAERMAAVINTMHAALSRHGKRLIVRDFLRTPAEMAQFREAMANVPDDVWVFSKCVPNDWQYRYPPHPNLGRVKPHVQIMELDLFNETAANAGLVMPALEYYRDQLLLARKNGLAGAIGRVDDGFATNEGTPARASTYAYSVLLNNADYDVDALWREYFVPFYGERAAPTAIEVLRETFDMVCAIRYTLGFWTGGAGSSVEYVDFHLVNHSSAIWSSDAKYVETEKLLMESGPEAVEAVVAEKRGAEETARACLKKLEENWHLFEQGRYEQLAGYFERAARQAELGRMWARTYFAMRWVRRSDSPRARAELEAAAAECDAFIRAAPSAEREHVARLPDLVDEADALLARTDDDKTVK